MEKIVFIVEKTRTGFSAYAENFEKYSVGTTGGDMKELKDNIFEAINFHLDEEGIQVDDGQIVLKYDFDLQIPDTITFVIEKTRTGLSAYAKEDSIHAGTSGDTMDELKQNIQDAYNSYAEVRGWPEVSINEITLEYNL